MKPTITPPQQEQAADYVLNQLSDAEMAMVESAILADQTMRREVKELTDAAASLTYSTKQSPPPPKAGEKRSDSDSKP